MTPTSLVDDIVDLQERFTATAVQVQGFTTSGIPTSAQVEAIRSALAGYEGEVRGIIRELDSHDEVEDWLLVEDGAKTIAMWTWRRETRRGLLLFWAGVHATAEVAKNIRGTKARIVVVRDGDTWQSIAQRELRDWRGWVQLLEANPTLTAGALTSGTSIVIPEPR